MQLMTRRISIVYGAVQCDTYLWLCQSYFLASAFLNGTQQQRTNTMSLEVGMDIPIGSKFCMLVLIEEFLITDDAAMRGFHKRNIPFQVKARSFPFMFQFFRCDSHRCVAVSFAYIVDQLRYRVDITPFCRTQVEIRTERRILCYFIKGFHERFLFLNANKRLSN